MTNIRDSVWKLIDADPSIQLDLSRGLVNMRALARHCQKNGIAGNEDALISAIRRYPKQSKTPQWQDNARNVIRHSNISTKSHIVNIALTKGEETQKVLPKLFSLVQYERGETLRIVQGEESIKLLVDEKNAEKMLDLIPRKNVLKVQRGLAEINMHLHPDAVTTPGIMYVLCMELARNHINMYELMSCVPEMLLFVEEKDVLNAYRVLFELCHPEKRTSKPE
ncbi:hypothetical protein HY572_05240 [Candidatus Micrarchaeota archaeon]|nr:hypothetical protein [Candidatus Micrarchaeota archaeon]